MSDNEAPQANKKLRIRTEVERAVQGANLSKLKSVLEQCGIKPIISGGTLLGAVRDGDFIAWDWDAEFFLLYHEVAGKHKTIEERAQDCGFTVQTSDYSKSFWKIVLSKDAFEFELRAWQQMNNFYQRGSFKIPSEYFLQLSKVELRGTEYFAPAGTSAYLEYVYGKDWQVPNRSADKNEYLTSEFYSKHTSILRRIQKKANVITKMFIR